MATPRQRNGKNLFWSNTKIKLSEDRFAYFLMAMHIFGFQEACARHTPFISRCISSLGCPHLCPEEGYEHFEFMDAGLPFKKHGYREFILRFGGKQSSTRRWFRFRWKWLNNLYAACIFSCKTIKTYFLLNLL